MGRISRKWLALVDKHDSLVKGKVDVIRNYSFGGGHWRNGHGIMDKYVKAWRERPEPYKEAQDE